MKFNPTKPRIKGRKILNIPGKKDVTFIFKNAFRTTSNILIEKKRPKYKNNRNSAYLILENLNYSLFFNFYFFVIPIHYFCNC